MYRRYCRSLEDIYDLFLFPYWPDNPSNTVYFLEPGLKGAHCNHQQQFNNLKIGSYQRLKINGRMQLHINYEDKQISNKKAMFLLLSPISHTIYKSPLLSETTYEYKAENLVPISRNCRYFRFSLRNAEFQGQSLKIKNLVTLYSVQRIESRLKSPIRFGRQVPVLRSRVR